MPTDLTQLNVHVPDDVIESVTRLRDRYGWTKRDLVMTAIQTLARVMDGHEAYAAQYADDERALYMRLAVEMPSGFLEVPKDGVRVGRASDLPAVLVDNWLVFPDRETGALLAEEQGGERRIARIVDGEVKPVKLPSPEDVALN